MPTVDLKLFAGQGTGRTDKAATTCIGSALWRVLSMCLTNKRSNWVEQIHVSKNYEELVYLMT